jgi:hypothetical protein
LSQRPHSRYHHKQIGWLSNVAHVFGLVVAVIAIANIDFRAETRWIIVALFLMLIATAITFSSLTTEVNQEEFRAGFGPFAWPSKRAPLAEIAGVLPARTSILTGWGIRITMRGWLYSVSGRNAVIVGLRNGKQFLIGTDDPTGLADAINNALPQPAIFTTIRGAR